MKLNFTILAALAALTTVNAMPIPAKMTSPDSSFYSSYAKAAGKDTSSSSSKAKVSPLKPQFAEDFAKKLNEKSAQAKKDASTTKQNTSPSSNKSNTSTNRVDIKTSDSAMQKASEKLLDQKVRVPTTREDPHWLERAFEIANDLGIFEQVYQWAVDRGYVDRFSSWLTGKIRGWWDAYAPSYIHWLWEADPAKEELSEINSVHGDDEYRDWFNFDDYDDGHDSGYESNKSRNNIKNNGKDNSKKPSADDSDSGYETARPIPSKDTKKVIAEAPKNIPAAGTKSKSSSFYADEGTDSDSEDGGRAIPSKKANKGKSDNSDSDYDDDW